VAAKAYNSVVTPNEIQTDAREVELKIVRTGQLFAAYWRIEQNAEWNKAGEIALNFSETVLAGLIASNTAEEVTAEFKYIRLLPV
jgi:hypothetical protein